MIKTILISLMLIAGFAAIAQPGQALKNKTPEERASMVTERMRTRLNLTPDQTAKIKKVNFEKAQKVDSIRAKYAQGNKQGMMQEIKPVQAAAEAQYKQILTPEQMNKYIQMREEAKQRVAEKQKMKKSKATDKTKTKADGTQVEEEADDLLDE